MLRVAHNSKLIFLIVFVGAFVVVVALNLRVSRGSSHLIAVTEVKPLWKDDYQWRDEYGSTSPLPAWPLGLTEIDRKIITGCAHLVVARLGKGNQTPDLAGEGNQLHNYQLTRAWEWTDRSDANAFASAILQVIDQTKQPHFISDHGRPECLVRCYSPDGVVDLLVDFDNSWIFIYSDDDHLRYVTHNGTIAEILWRYISRDELPKPPSWEIQR